MPFIEVASSALAPGISPVRVHYRDAGSGPPLVLLHGGWGYEIYPFDRQIDALAVTHRCIAPDRTGYGGSGRLSRQETDFHQRAASETFAVIDALGLEAPVIWGHSDGAVIALRMALSQPDRVRGLVLEATHFFRTKPASRAFFEAMMRNPDDLGERVTGVLAREHGDAWRDLIRTNGDAWLRIAADPSAPTADLYDGRLGELRVPALVIHGAKDPRTEPGELDALREAIGRTHGSAPISRTTLGPASAGADRHRAAAGRRPDAGGGVRVDAGADVRGTVGTEPRVGPVFEILAEGGHSPHSERATADAVTATVVAFVSNLPGPPAFAARRALP